MNSPSPRVTTWFAVAVFGYYYKAVVCGVLSDGLGCALLCEPRIRGIDMNHWIEIVLYCPLLWLALHQVNAAVFAAEPAEEPARSRHRRRALIGEGAIALVLYGTGLHIANVIELYSRQTEGVSQGGTYQLVYFLDEGLSHYVQFVPLFFVLGWFVLHDRPGRSRHQRVALLIGVGHGVERAIGLVEGGKWALAIPAVLWLGLCVALRARRLGRAACSEFFVRYAIAFCLTLPLAQLAYLLRFGSFVQPSELGSDGLTELGLEAAVSTVALTALLVGLARFVPRDRAWHAAPSGQVTSRHRDRG